MAWPLHLVVTAEVSHGDVVLRPLGSIQEKMILFVQTARFDGE